MTTLFLLRCQSISPNSRGFFFLNFSLSPAFVIALSIKGQRNNSSSNIILLKNQKNGKQRVNKGGSCVNLSGLQLQDFVDLFAWDNLVFFFLWIQCCVVFQLGSAFFFTCFLVLPLISVRKTGSAVYRLSPGRVTTCFPAEQLTRGLISVLMADGSPVRLTLSPEGPADRSGWVRKWRWLALPYLSAGAGISHLTYT